MNRVKFGFRSFNQRKTSSSIFILATALLAAPLKPAIFGTLFLDYRVKILSYWE
ncbi:UNVERIFIED_CONTAM: hypothetical protein GTU68_018177 [Idotea baltica]|nr:hypothetical protein [Idotea baltica]